VDLVRPGTAEVRVQTSSRWRRSAASGRKLREGIGIDRSAGISRTEGQSQQGLGWVRQPRLSQRIINRAERRRRKEHPVTGSDDGVAVAPNVPGDGAARSHIGVIGIDL